MDSPRMRLIDRLYRLLVDTGSIIMTMSVCSVNKEDLSNYRPMSNLSFLPFNFLPIDFLPFVFSAF